MNWNTWQVTLVRSLLEKIITSQGFHIVEDSRFIVIASKVSLLDTGDVLSFGVQSVKVKGIKKLKTEDSSYLVTWDNDTNSLSCQCKQAEYNFSCRHRRLVAKEVMGVNLEQVLRDAIDKLSNTDKISVKNYVLTNYGLDIETIKNKGGIINALSAFQRLHLYQVIKSSYGVCGD